MRHVFLYISPSGTTARVVETMMERVREAGFTTETFKVGKAATVREIAGRLSGRPDLCLWVGSPVYVDHALPNIIETVRAVEIASPVMAAAFVTYGGVTTGTALAELLDLLREKGFTTLGGMKILCQHSSFRATHRPMAEGHPDQADRELIRRFVDRVLAKTSGTSGRPGPLEPQLYDYQTPKMKAIAAQINLEKVKSFGELPGVTPDLCTRCGLCVTACPVAALALDPYPKRDSACIRCLVCVHDCPRQAFPFDAEAHEAMIRGMAGKSEEKAESAMYLAP